MRLQRGARDGKAKADTACIAAARSFEPDEGFEYRCKLVFGQIADDGPGPSSAMVMMASPGCPVSVTRATSP